MKIQPQLAIDRYNTLKNEGLETIEIIRHLREEFALSIGQVKEIMIQQETGLQLNDYQESLLLPLKEAFQYPDLPTPCFEIGDDVVTTGTDHTYRKGVIRDRIWHHRDGVWHYYIECDGKKISKRYLEKELQSISNESSEPGKKNIEDYAGKKRDNEE